MNKNKTPNEIPDWLAVLPKNSLISSKDFASILGVNCSTLHKRLHQQDNFPQPFKKIQLFSMRGVNQPAFYWKAVTVRNYIREQIILSEAKK